MMITSHNLVGSMTGIAILKILKRYSSPITTQDIPSEEILQAFKRNTFTLIGIWKKEWLDTKVLSKFSTKKLVASGVCSTLGEALPSLLTAEYYMQKGSKFEARLKKKSVGNSQDFSPFH